MFRITVAATERAVEYVEGRFTQVLEPGRHRRPRRATYVRVPVKHRLTTLAPQEILTADGIAVRTTLTVRWVVAEPRAYVETADEGFDIVYLAAQIALRDAVAGLDAGALAQGARHEIGESLLPRLREAGATTGIDVLEAVAKDVILPPELRAAYSELVTTKLRGAAQLEAARAETAALRSLANGARLLDEHPALARLRLVQALPAGSTVELSAPER